MIYTVELPWPTQGATLNSRKHWAAKAKIQKAIKEETMALCNHLPQQQNAQKIAITIIFYPPDNRRRDADNLLAAMKPALDAIANQLDVDDSLFWPMTLDKGEKTKDGKVEIIIDITLHETQ